MRLNAFVSIAALLISGLSFAETVPATVNFQDLSSAQKALFGTYAFHGHKPPANADLGKIFDRALDDSMKTTFTSVTHALENTQLSSGGNALSLVQKVTEINGETDGAPSNTQFNLAVVWREDAQQQLRSSGFLTRLSTEHGDESGLSVDGGSTGIHALFSETNVPAGHVHIDYRVWSITDIFDGGGEGHMQAYNSDVRAVGPELDAATGRSIDNYARHEKWFGRCSAIVWAAINIGE